MRTAGGIRDPFSQVHPGVQAAYFTLILGICAFCLHPAILGSALLGAVLYAGILRGWRHIARLLLTLIVPGAVVVTLTNAAFNHNGVTLLVTLQSGNSITLEAIVYGLVLAVVFACTISWFVVINRLMTRDKIVFLCSHLLPSLGLLLSLTFRFIPLLGIQFRRVQAAQKGIGRSVREAKWREKFRVATNVFAIMTTWALETSVTTADSMRGRGYGTGRRRAYNPFRFKSTDGVLSGILLLAASLTCLSWYLGGLRTQYDPAILIGHTPWTVVGCVAFTCLTLLPTGMFLGARWGRPERTAIAVRPPYFSPQR